VCITDAAAAAQPLLLPLLLLLLLLLCVCVWGGGRRRCTKVESVVCKATDQPLKTASAAWNR